MTTPDDPYASPGEPGATPGLPGPMPPPTPAAPTPPYGQTPYAQTPYAQSPYGTPTYGDSGYGPPTYPQPGYGPTGYGQPPAYGQPMYGYPGTKPGTNGLAIAGFICSFTGIVTLGVGTIVGLVLSIVALSQIKKRPQNGRGLAIAGICISAVLIVGGLLIALVASVAIERQANHCRAGDYTGQDYQDNCVGNPFYDHGAAS